MPLYPLKFKPRLLEKMWGGRKIESVLGKSLPPEKLIGESWELYDFPPAVIDDSGQWVSSEIANGPLAGRTLHWAIGEFGAELMGDVALTPAKPAPGGASGGAASTAGQFPLLVKFLDARQDLSVQVHPDACYANAHADAYLKTEAWYVLQSDTGARVLKGLKPGVTRDAFAAALKSGTVEDLVTSIPAKPGQCHFLPSGTVHALGAGILAAEVQTPSDTTFRVFDFNRVDPSTGESRKLHVEQALECIDFNSAHLLDPPRSHVAGLFTTVTRLATSPFFKLEKVRFTEGVEEPVPYDEPVVWIMLEGNAHIRVADLPHPIDLSPGDTLLLPAAMNHPILKTLTDCVWLETTFPTTAG